jgi:FKBP-type peptidyl-prolyl cis-trans isomerase FklB
LWELDLAEPTTKNGHWRFLWGADAKFITRLKTQTFICLFYVSTKQTSDHSQNLFFSPMTRNSFVLAGIASAFLFANTAIAQTKKPTPTKAVVPVAKTTSAPATVKLTNANDSLSYSIGVNIAQSFKQQGLSNVNTALVARAMNDALKGNALQLTQEQCMGVLNAFMQKQYAAKQAEGAKAAEGNKKIGTAFLTENKTKPGVITTASGLQYSVEKEGTGAKPTANDKVKVHYTGKLIDGKVFDSSVERGQPAEFGVTQVIKGWTEALQLMTVGSKYKLYIPSDLAYGDRGAGADIGPGATLIFDVELLDIVK